MRLFFFLSFVHSFFSFPFIHSFILFLLARIKVLFLFSSGLLKGFLFLRKEQAVLGRLCSHVYLIVFSTQSMIFLHVVYRLCILRDLTSHMWSTALIRMVGCVPMCGWLSSFTCSHPKIAVHNRAIEPNMITVSG